MSDMTPPAPPAPPSPPLPPHPPHPPRRRRHRRLRRDRSHRVLGGVCAGIARTYGIDIVLVRVLFVIAAIAWIGLPLYLVLWIALPADHDVDEDTEPRDMGLLLALMLIGIGALIFVRHVLPHSWTNGGGVFAPLLLIGGGVAILVLRRPGGDDDDDDTFYDEEHRDGEPIGNGPAQAASAPAVPGESTTPSPSAGTTITDVDPAATQPTPTTTQLAPDDDVPPTAWSQTRPWANGRSARREYRREWRTRRPRPFLGPLTIAVLMIGAGVASLLEATSAVSVNLAVVLAIGTCIVGAALIVSAWAGRARGLIVLGLLLACAASVATVIDVPLTGGFGARTYRPLSAEDVQPTYKLGAGTLRLDFNDARWSGSDVEVHAQVGAGELHVNVPANTNVVVDSHVGAGDIEVFDHVDNGWDVDQHTTSAPALPGAPTLHLVLRVGAGKIWVNT